MEMVYGSVRQDCTYTSSLNGSNEKLYTHSQEKIGLWVHLNSLGELLHSLESLYCIPSRCDLHISSQLLPVGF